MTQLRRMRRESRIRKKKAKIKRGQVNESR